MRNDGYINIQGWMINELGLSGNELLLYALIFGFSQDGKTEFRGSISYIQNALKISNRSAAYSIKNLIEKNLIFKSIKTTGNTYSANLEVVQKLHSGYAKIAQESYAKSSHNNNYNNYKDNSEASSPQPLKSKPLKKEVTDHLFKWSENRRGFKFISYPKQMKAFKIAQQGGLKVPALKQRWIEMESDDFWKKTGFDWTNVVASFNRKK